ncbi:MAG: manganese efflux pump MntP family protein, partial [Nitrososphaerota archaeon]|nr:manganese efflux pump MntP family protein [Nitrososphaerota archaeon]
TQNILNRKILKTGRRSHGKGQILDAVTLLAAALSLAMDAFSVSVAYAIAARGNILSNALKMAFAFGSFQAFMPPLGWTAGTTMLNLISGIDHWLAFSLLLLVGCRMIYESKKPETKMKEKNLSLCTLFILAIATSIDALAVGISFAFLKIPITHPIIVIGTVTFALSLIGAAVGDKIKGLWADKIQIAGGIILIAIGVKILIEHLA